MVTAQLAPLTAGAAVTSWRLDPTGVALAVVLGGGYLLGVRRLRARGASWPLGRSIMFLGAGMGSLILVTCSFLGVYAPVLRWVAVIQACLLLLICPLLIGLGAPVALGLAVRGPSDRRAVLAPLWRLLRAPGIAPLVIMGVTSLLVFTPWLGWSVSGNEGRALTALALLAAGLTLALPITDEGAQTSSLAYAAMLALGLIEFLLDALPGIILRLNTHLIAGAHWVAVTRSWGPSPLSDQKLAGDWLWFFAEAGDLPFLIILILAWIRSDAREAADQDAVLDQLEAEHGDADGLMRPWWETEKR